MLGRGVLSGSRGTRAWEPGCYAAVVINAACACINERAHICAGGSLSTFVRAAAFAFWAGLSSHLHVDTVGASRGERGAVRNDWRVNVSARATFGLLPSCPGPDVEGSAHAI